MRESDFYNKVVRAARGEGWLLARWADGSGVKSPFDITGADRVGLAVGLEVKIDTRPKGIDWDKGIPVGWFRQREHQWNWLREYSERGSWGLLLIGEEATSQWYMLEVKRGLDENRKWKSGVKEGRAVTLRELLIGSVDPTFCGIWSQLDSLRDVRHLRELTSRGLLGGIPSE